MATITEATAEHVRAAIDSAERSNKWTAGKAGIPTATFARKVHGHRDFTLTELLKIALALGVEPSSLLPEEFMPVPGAAPDAKTKPAAFASGRDDSFHEDFDAQYPYRAEERA